MTAHDQDVSQKPIKSAVAGIPDFVLRPFTPARPPAELSDAEYEAAATAWNAAEMARFDAWQSAQRDARERAWAAPPASRTFHGSLRRLRSILAGKIR